MRKLLLASVAAMGASLGAAQAATTPPFDPAVTPTPDPGTITVRLNGKLSFFAGAYGVGDFNGSYYYDVATGITKSTPFYVNGATGNGSSSITAAAYAALPASTQSLYRAANLNIEKMNSFGYTDYARFYPGFDGVAANGIKYGVALRVQQADIGGACQGVYGSCSQTDRARTSLIFRSAYGYVGTDTAGTLRFGMADSVASLFQLGTSENFNTGGWNGDIPSSLPGVFDTPWPFPDVGSSYDINRVVYLSPRFYGFDFGIDFAPTSNGLNGDNGDGCQSVQYSNPGIAGGPSIAGPGCDLLSATSTADYKRFRNEMNVGARYTGTFGDVGFSAYGDYLFSGVTSNSAYITAPVAVTGVKQPYDGYSVGYGGAQLTYAGFTIGSAIMGGNINNVDTNQALMPVGTKKETAFVVGGSYTYGPLIVGVQYFNSWLAGNQTAANKIGSPATTGGAPTTANVGGYSSYGIAAGGTYTVAPGLNLYLEYLYGQVKQPGYNLLLGTANAITSPTIGQRVQTQYMGIGTALTW